METVVLKVLVYSSMACQVTPTPEVGTQLTLETTGASENVDFIWLSPQSLVHRKNLKILE